MRRTACVDASPLVLQLLLQRHPDWNSQPAAVVSKDRPPGTVVAANQNARTAGVRSGMHYATALSLVAHLQAITFSPQEITDGEQIIINRLLSISPSVEESTMNRAL